MFGMYRFGHLTATTASQNSVGVGNSDEDNVVPGKSGVLACHMINVSAVTVPACASCLFRSTAHLEATSHKVP